MLIDKLTEDYYLNASEELCDRYLSASNIVGIDFFSERLKYGSKVLDIGAGSGRDMLYLQERGFDVYGIDYSIEMISSAVKRNSLLENRLIYGIIPSSKQYFDFLFQGIVCSAVFMHLTDSLVSQGAYTVATNLTRGGSALISVPVTRNDIDINGRDIHGRLFVLREILDYRRIFSEAGLKLVDVFEGIDTLGREGIFWNSMLFELV